MIVISEFMDESSVASLRADFAVRHEPSMVDRPAELSAAMQSAVALIVRNRTQVDAALIANAPRLKVVGRLGVGLDNIDTAACAVRGIEVIAATGANAVSVAEYVVTTAMMLLRGVYGSSAAVAAGVWPRAQLSQGKEMRGKTLGLIGFGSIGRVTARLAHNLGMQVVAHDPLVAADDAAWREHGVAHRSLETLLAQADVVSLHVPLVALTRGMLNPSRIASMKRGAIVINTARGGIVDEEALIDALRKGALGGAALDVFEHEPLAARPTWVDVPNLVLTPHVAGVTAESNVRVSEMIAQRVAAALHEMGAQ
ncbi:MAG TPA: hydroxyacid dehydrogenase [Casimicrobiaceae bacterium]|nr:hydroxyacid dehydrogenase [Casimicrobiaceae bacterium]